MNLLVLTKIKPFSIIQTHRPLTVSTLAHYCGPQCDEYLRLSLNPKIESNQPELLQHSPTRQRGINFEDKIKSYYSSFILPNIHNENELLSYLRSSKLYSD